MDDDDYSYSAYYNSYYDTNDYRYTKYDDDCDSYYEVGYDGYYMDYYDDYYSNSTETYYSFEYWYSYY